MNKKLAKLVITCSGAVWIGFSDGVGAGETGSYSPKKFPSGDDGGGGYVGSGGHTFENVPNFATDSSNI